jgi:hypothetical protein
VSNGIVDSFDAQLPEAVHGGWSVAAQQSSCGQQQRHQHQHRQRQRQRWPLPVCMALVWQVAVWLAVPSAALASETLSSGLLDVFSQFLVGGWCSMADRSYASRWGACCLRLCRLCCALASRPHAMVLSCTRQNLRVPGT